MRQVLFQTVGVDLLWLSRGILGISALVLEQGQPLIALCLVVVAFDVLQNANRIASTKPLEKWLILSI